MNEETYVMTIDQLPDNTVHDKYLKTEYIARATCVRCDKKYDPPNHPLSHFRVICNECHKESPENLYDKMQYSTNSIEIKKE